MVILMTMVGVTYAGFGCLLAYVANSLVIGIIMIAAAVIACVPAWRYRLIERAKRPERAAGPDDAHGTDA